jgi:hypothetical protein
MPYNQRWLPFPTRFQKSHQISRVVGWHGDAASSQNLCNFLFFLGSLDAKLVLKSRLRCEKGNGINSLRIQGCVQFYFRGLTRRPPLENFEKELSTHICQGLEQLVHMLHPHKLNSNWVIDNKRWTKFRVHFTSKLKQCPNQGTILH